MKKFISITLLTLSAVCLFTSCGGGEDSPSEDLSTNISSEIESIEVSSVFNPFLSNNESESIEVSIEESISNEQSSENISSIESSFESIESSNNETSSEESSLNSIESIDYSSESEEISSSKTLDIIISIDTDSGSWTRPELA